MLLWISSGGDQIALIDPEPQIFLKIAGNQFAMELLRETIGQP